LYIHGNVMIENSTLKLNNFGSALLLEDGCLYLINTKVEMKLENPTQNYYQFPLVNSSCFNATNNELSISNLGDNCKLSDVQFSQGMVSFKVSCQNSKYDAIVGILVGVVVLLTIIATSVGLYIRGKQREKQFQRQSVPLDEDVKMNSLKENLLENEQKSSTSFETTLI